MLVLVGWACAPGPTGGNSPYTRDPGPRDGAADGAGSALDTGAAGTEACDESRRLFGAFSAWDRGDDWARQHPDGREDIRRSAGLVVEDLDEDGVLDVFVTGDGACLLYAGQPDGRFVDVSVDRLPSGGLDCGAWGAAAADLDGDDRLDLVVSGWAGSPQVWLNGENGRFKDMTPDVGLERSTPVGRSPSLGDMDGDGDLDLFMSTHLDQDRQVVANGLFENQDGRFVERTERLLSSTATEGATFLASWLDIDQDGDLDLYIINDYGFGIAPNQLLRNTLETGRLGFADASVETGLGFPAFAMGNAVTDLNGDGLPDFVISDIHRLHLLLSTEDGWVEAAASQGLLPQQEQGQLVAWGVQFADLDNDGLDDLLVPFGPIDDVLGEIAEDAIELAQPDAVFRQQEDGQFEDVAGDWGLDQRLIGRSTLAVDLDGDGWLDVFKRDFLGGPTQLYRGRPGCNRSLSIHLRGAPGRRQAIGAKVVVEAEDRSWTRWNLPTNTGLSTTGPPRVHIGLGRRVSVSRVEVTWPSGVVTTVEAPSIDGPLVIEEPGRPAAVP